MTGEHSAVRRESNPSPRMNEVVMTRTELKEIVCRIIDQMSADNDDTPVNACIFGDSCDSCDITSRYAVGEED